MRPTQYDDEWGNSTNTRPTGKVLVPFLQSIVCTMCVVHTFATYSTMPAKYVAVCTLIAGALRAFYEPAWNGWQAGKEQARREAQREAQAVTLKTRIDDPLY